MSAMTLYHFPPTRSNRALWAVRELGIDVTVKTVKLLEGEQNKPEYKKINKLGVVPSLEVDGVTIGESAAIVAFLADQHPEKGLAPAVDAPDRGLYYHWLIFGPAELDHYLVTITQNTRFLPPDKRDLKAAANAQERFDMRAEVLSETLWDKPYILGDSFSAADISVGHSCAWAKMVEALSSHKVLMEYVKRLEARPAFQAVWGKEVSIFPDQHAKA